MSRIDTETVLRAVQFAIKAHEGQLRKYVDEPYIMHPLRVAQRVVAIPDTGSYPVIIALFHDIFEDCSDISWYEVEKQFGQTVFAGVELLTDEKAVKGGPNRAQRKEATRLRLLDAPTYIQNIKCADILDNLPSIVIHDKGFAKVYVKENLALLGVLYKADATILDELAGVLDWAQKEVNA